MCVGAKRSWSPQTRAVRVSLGLRRTMFRSMNLYQVVAPGPKIAVIDEHVQLTDRSMEERNRRKNAGLPPPYRAILPVRA